MYMCDRGMKWGPVHWHILPPGSLGVAKSFYSIKKVNIDNMAWQQSDTLRSNSK